MSTTTYPLATERGPAASRLGAALRGRTGDPAWVRPPVLALIISTLVLYLWAPDRNGWANNYKREPPSKFAGGPV